jgi:hypothetical protein
MAHVILFPVLVIIVIIIIIIIIRSTLVAISKNWVIFDTLNTVRDITVPHELNCILL